MKTWSERQQEIGEARGEARGYAHGRLCKAREVVLLVLGVRFGSVPPAIVTRVQRIEDETILDAPLLRAARATTLAETGLLT